MKSIVQTILFEKVDLQLELCREEGGFISKLLYKEPLRSTADLHSKYILCRAICSSTINLLCLLSALITFKLCIIMYEFDKGKNHKLNLSTEKI